MREGMLLGNEALERLNRSTVAVFGLGGVGSFAAEALARGGIGHIVLIDGDTVDITNINRQLPASDKTIGLYKTDVMKERLCAINPNAAIDTLTEFYTPDTREKFFRAEFDYIIDAVDDVTAKIDLALEAKKRGIKLISSLGTGNKLDPTQFKVSDIYETSVCPLARVMRRELKKRGLDELKVVWSKEKPLVPAEIEDENKKKRGTPGSVSFVPPVAGFILAGEVIKSLAGVNEQ